MSDLLWGAEPEGRPKPGLDLDWLYAVWARRKWLALLVFAVPFAAGASLILSLPSLYRSTATVLVERQQVPESFVRPTVTSELDTRLHTISQEILSRARLEALISRFGLYGDLRRSQPSEEVVARMRRDIQLELKGTERGRNSTTVAFALSYRGFDPQLVAMVTNTLVSFYIDENLKVREQQATGTVEFMKAQVTETKKRLDEQEHRVSEFRRRHLGELPQQMQANLATLEALGTQLRLNNDNQVRAVERREALTSQLAEAATLAQTVEVSSGPAGATAVALGPDSVTLRLIRLKQELTAAQTRYTDAHPTVKRLQDEIAAVTRDLARAKDETKPETASGPPSALALPPTPYVLRLRESLRAAETEVKVLKIEEQRIRGAIAAYQGRIENTPKREQEFQDVSRDYEATKEQHQLLTKKYDDAQLAESMEQRQKGERFRVLDPAVPMPSPAAPNRLRLFLMLFAVTVGLAAGAVVLAEILDTSFHSADDLRAQTGVSVLVGIAPITTDADARRRRLRVRLAAVGALVSLILVAGAAYVIAHGNEQLARML
jgi:polysaccharide chain length determinant protein (PEP-CTERM system associated)